MANTLLYDVAAALLDAIVDHFTTEGVSLPTRRIVAEGEVAWDCEQVAVRLVRTYPGLPGQEGADPRGIRCAQPRAAQFGVSIIRCVAEMDKQGNPPAADDVTASAQALLVDAFLMPIAVQSAVVSEPSAIGRCDSVLIGSVSTVGPQGLFGGYEMLVDLVTT